MTNVKRKPNFKAALNRIPFSTPWTSHGRDPAKGLDCLGLVLLVYRYAGVPQDDLDVPYGKSDQNKPHRVPLIIRQLERRFWRVPTAFPAECEDGDILVVGQEKHNHVGIVADGCFVEQTVRRVKVTRLSILWPEVTAVYRLK